MNSLIGDTKSQLQHWIEGGSLFVVSVRGKRNNIILFNILISFVSPISESPQYLRISPIPCSPQKSKRGVNEEQPTI